ncbi:MAG TPA: DUF362 domain-containing protein, partial [Thermoplasmatales archaeon]|nr:DUF362 domain-containing protein [Thermoplasmatales archaeon]
PLLKKHPINNGVTLSGKNLFGTFIGSVKELHPYHISGQTMGNPAPQVDLLAHESIGRKTILYIGDGLFGTVEDHRTIAKFKMYPFNDDWTNSLFFSQDPVAIDSVMYDVLYAEGRPCPIEGAQNYLHQGAEPPTGVYDPEQDGVYLSESLGVHEHWDPKVSIFSRDRYSGYENQGIDFIPIGEEFAHPSVVIMQPCEDKLYINGHEKSFKILWKTIYSFPATIVIGNITVKAEVNNIDMIDEIRFYIDGKLQYTDDTPPYEWEWRDFSWSHHMLMVSAYINHGEYEIKAYRSLWKFF